MLSYPLWPPEGGRVLRFNNGKAKMSPQEKHLRKVKGQVPKGWLVQGQRDGALGDQKRGRAGGGRHRDSFRSYPFF